MAIPLDCLSSLLCAEDCRFIVDDEEVVSRLPQQKQPHQILFFDDFSFDYSRISSLLEKERQLTPRDDYLTRLHSGDLDVSARNDSVEWIYKVHRHYSFGPLTACLSVNYLDRFLSQYELPRGKQWMVQLLSVSCLSLATKMEESDATLPLDLQVVEGKLVFEARTIQRMELLLLSVLKWRTNAVTPLSFIDYFLHRTINPEKLNPKSMFFRSVELVLITTKGIEFLEFWPSEIALAVIISIVGETQTIDFNGAFESCCSSCSSSSSPHLNKERVLKCYDLIQELVSSTAMGREGIRGSCSRIHRGCVGTTMSPSGVLDASRLLSFDSSSRSRTSAGVGFGSGVASAPKRRKLDLL